MQETCVYCYGSGCTDLWHPVVFKGLFTLIKNNLKYNIIYNESYNLSVDMGAFVFFISLVHSSYNNPFRSVFKNSSKKLISFVVKIIVPFPSISFVSFFQKFNKISFISIWFLCVDLNILVPLLSL